MRLQVFLSHNGVCSRREAMSMIQSGRVKINGQIQKEPSTQVEGCEEICVDGKKILVQNYAYIMLHKPPGYTTTKDDPHADKTVLDLLPGQWHHLSPVGRLDRDSEGLLLLTNDGDFAYRMTHPKFHMDKTYLVRVKGRLTKDSQKQLQQGVLVDNDKTAPCRIEQVRYHDVIPEGGEGTEFQITIHEGRKRQIRLMLRSVGYQVCFLKRVSLGPLTLGDLKMGLWRTLTEDEISLLRKNNK